MSRSCDATNLNLSPLCNILSENNDKEVSAVLGWAGLGLAGLGWAGWAGLAGWAGWLGWAGQDNSCLDY